MPAYYAIIPASVRYDKRLNFGARLLYGEITALCNEKGFCWATNEYFAELYEVSGFTISKWISSLVQSGYISNEVVKNEAGTIRKIFITDHGASEKSQTGGTSKMTRGVSEKSQEGFGENAKYNNTVNNTSNTTNTDDFLFNTQSFKDAWNEWTEYRKEKKVGRYTKTGLKRTFKDLAELCKMDESLAIKIIHQSMSKGWQGLFAYKGAIVEKNGNYNQQIEEAKKNFKVIHE